MAKMAQSELSSILEECIIQIQAGKSIDETLALYPYHAKELRPLLETAAGMRLNQALIPPPVEAMAHSRRLFTTQITMQARRQSVFHSIHLRLAVSLSIVVLLFLGLLSTGLGSASALPGDTLYPVKLALEQVQLNLAAGSAQRLKLLENFDQVRSQEVNQLKTTDRMISVTFTGIPTESADGWMVSGVKLNLTGPEAEHLANWRDFVVQVTGETEGQSVNVTDIQPRILTFSGQIQKIGPHIWTVDGIEINLDSSTQINGTGAAGQEVDISAKRQENGQLLAFNIDVHSSSDTPSSRRSPEPEGTDQHSGSTQPTQTENTDPSKRPGDDPPQTTPQPGGESTRVTTGTGEHETTPTRLSPTEANRTAEPSGGQNQDDHRRTLTPVPSQINQAMSPTARSSNH